MLFVVTSVYIVDVSMAPSLTRGVRINQIIIACIYIFLPVPINV